MAKSRNQKGKILVIEHLLQGTGESRIVTMQEILDKLLEYGITAERKSIYDDIEALREFGLDVQYKRGRPGGYYLAGGQEIAAAPESVHTKEEAGISKNAETEKKSEPVIIYKENTLDKEEIQNTEKAMKLQCDASREKEIREYFGSYGVKNHRRYMIYFNLIQSICSNVFCRLFQITDTGRISKLIDHCIKSIRSHYALFFFETHAF